MLSFSKFSARLWDGQPTLRPASCNVSLLSQATVRAKSADMRQEEARGVATRGVSGALLDVAFDNVWPVAPNFVRFLSGKTAAWGTAQDYEAVLEPRQGNAAPPTLPSGPPQPVLRRAGFDDYD